MLSLRLILPLKKLKNLVQKYGKLFTTLIQWACALFLFLYRVKTNTIQTRVNDTFFFFFKEKKFIFNVPKWFCENVAGGEKKKASVKEIGRSLFNFRPGTACMDLQQDLTKKWWIKNKQSPAGTQEEEWRGFAQRTLRVNYSHVESQRQTRLQGATCHLFLEKNYFAKQLTESSTAFSGRNWCKQQVSGQPENPTTECLC